MKVLVTGANGFLGANIVAMLNQHGVSVRAFMRSSANQLGLTGCTFEPCYGDITKVEDVNKALVGCDYVIHAAACTGPSPNDYNHYFPVNVMGTRHLLAACQQASCKRLVFISSANTIGFGNLLHPGHEELPLSEPFRSSGYALTKLEAEFNIQAAVDRGQLDAVILNPAFMIGSRDHKPSSGRLLLSMARSNPVLLPPGGKSFVHVNDVALASLSALHRGEAGKCYLLANQNLSYHDFFNQVYQIRGKSRQAWILSEGFTKMLGALGSGFEHLGFKQDLNSINANLLCIKNYYSGQLASSTFGFQYTPISQAIEEAIAWFSNNGYLNSQKTPQHLRYA